jgi:glutamine amidotransferase
MCELLGMDCNTPTDITFSFAGFSRRGGATGPHQDGWGLAFFEGRAARTFLDPTPCAKSPLAAFLHSHPIKTLQAVAHIRRKTRGVTRLANTHPFQRELWGRSMVFAHNGTLARARELPLGGRYTPIGTTDSERAFCHLLERMLAKFPRPPRETKALWSFLAQVAGEVAQQGTFNFLLADGEYLYARCDTRLWHLVRKAPFGRATLKDDDVSVDFSTVTTPRDRVAVVSTTPLTVDEPWVRGDPATLWVFRRGALLATLPSGKPSRKALRIHAEDLSGL